MPFYQTQTLITSLNIFNEKDSVWGNVEIGVRDTGGEIIVGCVHRERGFKLSKDGFDLWIFMVFSTLDVKISVQLTWIDFWKAY